MLYEEDIVLIVFFGVFGFILLLVCACKCAYHMHFSLLQSFYHQQNRVYTEINIPVNVVVMGTDAVIIEQPDQSNSQVIGIRITQSSS